MSNSIILKDILNNESCELKQTIDNFMEESFNKLQNLMKSKVNKIISDKLDIFYNKESDVNTNELFDIPNDRVSLHKCEKPNLHFGNCFSLEYSNFPYEQRKVFYYKNILIIQNNDGHVTKENIYNHPFTIPMLFVLKYCNPINISNYLNCQSYNPECFYDEKFRNVDSSEFEEICKKEYNDIEEKKVKLENLIQDYTNKKKYYESLEEKNVQLEKLIQDYTNKKEYYESLEQQIIETRLEVENINSLYDELEEEKKELEGEKGELEEDIEELEEEKEELESMFIHMFLELEENKIPINETLQKKFDKIKINLIKKMNLLKKLKEMKK